MTRDAIDLQYLVADATDCVCAKKITKQAVTQANGIEIKKALAGKDNSCRVYIENTGSASEATIKAGEKQNACMGDFKLTLPSSSLVAFDIVRDNARFERKDGSIYIDFASGFTGNIWADAVVAGLHAELESGLEPST